MHLKRCPVVFAVVLAVAACGTQVAEKSCGSVEMRAENGAQYFLSRAGLHVLGDCFASAFQHHTSAGITLRLQGVDTIEVDRWTARGRRADDAVHIHNNNGHDSSSTNVCSKVGRRFGGILFTCTGQDLLYSLDGAPEMSNSRF
jgi:hypothetical protein